MKNSAVLLIDCPDKRGLVAAIANFLLQYDANILHADQHQDGQQGLFFMRVEWDLAGFSLARDAFHEKFKPLAEKFQLHWSLHWSTQIPNVALFVSKYEHCLMDILYRHRNQELSCNISLVISNHNDAKPMADFFKIPFHHFAIDAPSKRDTEQKQLALLQKNQTDLIVLARYMQVLSPEFVSHYPNQIINVHHSFLPAFSGARPYQQAFERGVKIIGATSHYVTAVLDDGPIIEQDVNRISHRDQVEDLSQKGQDLEKVVLSRALRWHIDHRILVYGKKTVIFD